MSYVGKYIDMFECAMKMLFLEKGYGLIQYLDIIGKRSMGFCHRRDGKGYYIPIADINKAVEEISNYLFLEGILSSWIPECSRELAECAQEGIVYGPVEEETAVRRIKNLYYHAENRYLYIQKNSEGKYYVTDPDGFPKILCNEKELCSLFCDRKGIIVRLKENNVKNYQSCKMLKDVEFMKTIWKAGWEFHRNLNSFVRKDTVLSSNFEGYYDNASSRITLLFGVMNFIQHMEKLFSFKNKFVGSGNDSSFRKLLCDMLQTAEQGEIDKLPRIEAAIWEEMSYEI